MAKLQRFFPYDPIRFRILFFACAMLAAAITAWALALANQSRDILAEGRAGFAAGLMFAFMYVVMRLRPKAGWGVDVEPLRVVISKPFRGEPMRVLWSEVTQLHRGGTKRNHLLFFLDSGGRIMVPAHLFRTTEEFEELCALALEKVPPKPLDA